MLLKREFFASKKSFFASKKRVTLLFVDIEGNLLHFASIDDIFCFNKKQLYTRSKELSFYKQRIVLWAVKKLHVHSVDSTVVYVVIKETYTQLNLKQWKECYNYERTVLITQRIIIY